MRDSLRDKVIKNYNIADLLFHAREDLLYEFAVKNKPCPSPDTQEGFRQGWNAAIEYLLRLKDHG